MHAWSDFAVRIETVIVLALDLRSVKPASDMLHYIYFLFCEARVYLCRL